MTLSSLIPWRKRTPAIDTFQNLSTVSVSSDKSGVALNSVIFSVSAAPQGHYPAVPIHDE
jgi:hypothetical protein